MMMARSTRRLVVASPQFPCRGGIEKVLPAQGTLVATPTQPVGDAMIVKGVATMTSFNDHIVFLNEQTVQANAADVGTGSSSSSRRCALAAAVSFSRGHALQGGCHQLAEVLGGTIVVIVVVVMMARPK
jgi:hypothetical protein